MFDIIMNFYGFLLCMIVGKLFECLIGKVFVVVGRWEYGFGDVFWFYLVEEMGKVLIEYGFLWEGKDYFIFGIMGEFYEVYFFNGFIFYQCFKYMVVDKMYFCFCGLCVVFICQFIEGCLCDGGLCLGEMECDCLIVYGVLQLLLEWLMYSFDVIKVDVCEWCGLMGYKGYCQICKMMSNVIKMNMLYVVKLLLQELIFMNVGVRMQLEDQFFYFW